MCVCAIEGYSVAVEINVVLLESRCLSVCNQQTTNKSTFEARHNVANLIKRPAELTAQDEQYILYRRH